MTFQFRNMFVAIKTAMICQIYIELCRFLYYISEIYTIISFNFVYNYYKYMFKVILIDCVYKSHLLNINKNVQKRL